METYTLILFALGVTSLATLFWLAVNAGRKHTLWGLLVLLLNLAVLVVNFVVAVGVSESQNRTLLATARVA